MHINENFGSQVHQLKSSFDKGSGPLGREVSALAHEKNAEKKATKELTSTESVNQQIIQSTLDVSFANGDGTSALVLKTAIEEINNILQTELGVSIEETTDTGVDVSPEATAERIVSLSAEFFSAYKEQHPEMDSETAATEFTKIISSGIDKGFSEARNVLDGLKVLEGDIASDIDKTYDLVQGKLQTFINTTLGNS